MLSIVYRLKDTIKWLGHTLKRDGILRMPLIFFTIIMILAFFVYSFESVSTDSTFNNIGDALWWAIVTMTTVGYGDRYPVTPAGRVLAIMVMGCGISITAMFTALIASRFVERSIREGKGMEQVKYTDHIILCDWNSNAMKILEKLLNEENRKVVMVNEISEEHSTSVIGHFKGKDLKFVRGDPVHEGVLSRANAGEAEVVIILAEEKATGEHPMRADDRTILVALNVRSINPKTRICCEVRDPDSLPHLKRAGVAMAIAAGENNDFMLSNSAVSPGVTMAARELVSWGGGQIIKQMQVPHSLEEWQFSSLHNHMREKHGALLIGVITEEAEGMGLDDILSGDMSAIERFIKKKFEGLEEAYFQKQKKISVRINPPDDFKVKHTDFALVIAKE